MYEKKRKIFLRKLCICQRRRYGAKFSSNLRDTRICGRCAIYWAWAMNNFDRSCLLNLQSLCLNIIPSNLIFGISKNTINNKTTAVSEARPSMRTVRSFFLHRVDEWWRRERIWHGSEQFHGKWLTMGDEMERAKEKKYKTEKKYVENSRPLMRRLCRRVRVVQLHKRAQKCTSTNSKKTSKKHSRAGVGPSGPRWEKYGTRELNKKRLIIAQV